MERPWNKVILFWLLGVLAAAQFAKMSIVAPIWRTQWSLSLSGLGWLVSLLEVGGAIFGLVAGFCVAWTGARRLLLAGLATLAVASAAEGLTADLVPLFVARGVEGIGYLLVVIAAPTAIAAITDDSVRPRALALWSTFVPVGIAVGGGLTAVMLMAVDVPAVMLVWAALLVAAIPLVMRTSFGVLPAHRIALPDVAAWVSTFGFGVYTMFISIVTMLLPSFLIEQSGATLGQAALVAALASLAALPAMLVAVVLMRKGDLPKSAMMRVAAIALVASAPFIYLLYCGGDDILFFRGLWAVLAVAVSGVVPPLIFARLPTLAGARTPEDSRIATANGLITQFGAGGALIGPPMGGMAVAAWGWPGLGILCGGSLFLLLGCIIISELLAADRLTCEA